MSKCINYLCTSLCRNVRLRQASWSECKFYGIQFKPYCRVCEECSNEFEKHESRLRDRMLNGQCVLDPTFDNEPELVDLTDNDVVPIPTALTEDERRIASLTESVLVELDPLIKKQFTVCDNHVLEAVEKEKKVEQLIQKELKELDEELSKMHSVIFKFDSYTKFEYEPELIIQNSPPGISILSSPNRRAIKLGEKVYANKYSDSPLPWVEGTVVGSMTDLCGNVEFSVEFNDGSFDFNLKQLAYKDRYNVQYEIGTRVIAVFHDSNPYLTNYFYAGIIAELPDELNSFRYLIFFDDGYVQYACRPEIRLVCHQSPDVHDDVHPNSREFIKHYLKKYPVRPMVMFKINQKVLTDYEGKWCNAKVVSIDASLVRLKCIDNAYNKHTEWIYRGSNRLEPIYRKEMPRSKSCPRTAVLTKIKKTLNKPYVELDEHEVNEEIVSKTENCQPIVQNEYDSQLVITIDMPADRPWPIDLKSHKCNYLCLSRVKYNTEQTTAFNTLSIPLRYGFQRSVIDDNDSISKVMYITPCGRKIRSESRMYSYLKKTCVQNRHCMTIEMFNFDFLVNPLHFYEVFMYMGFIDDISCGLESKPISVINCFDTSLPPKIEYITKHKPRPGVNLNLDPNFMSCCNCTDNCEDKSKCSCWRLTVNGRKHDLKNIGYKFKRLYEREHMGIFECNTNCRCSRTCLNRVVQQPMSATLQVFRTENKGWGLRTLVDIPHGSFICNYIGEIYKENDIETMSVNAGENGEFLSNLDYIEIVGEFKEGYENDAVSPPAVESNSGILSRQDLETAEMNNKRSKHNNVQHSNTEINGKHKLSKLNSLQTSAVGISDNFRRYCDDDAGMYVVNAKNAGNVGRYFNHSCEPNVFVQNVFVDTHDLRFPWQSYFASCFIPSGSELVYDYGYEVGSVKGVKVYCHCKSKYCRGRLL